MQIGCERAERAHRGAVLPEFTAANCNVDPISMAAAARMPNFKSGWSPVLSFEIASPPFKAKGVVMQVRHLPNRDRRDGGVTILKCASAHVPKFFLRAQTLQKAIGNCPSSVEDSTCCFYRAQAGHDTGRFFGTSHSSQSIRFSFCNSAISRSRSDWIFGFSGLRRTCWIQRFSFEKPIPRSDASCIRGSPLIKATRTASAWNSSVGRDAICFLICGTIRGQKSGTNPRQVRVPVGKYTDPTALEIVKAVFFGILNLSGCGE
ncbi:hypothetical protein [Antarctobacter heliothermus]|uniref:hypothetical protein n=1 Tax=Antarctobacter heliothermus TaxID=74033 RepID=UPI003CCBBB2E